jgi:hypothetical protein
MKLRHVYCDPRLVKRELCAGALGRDASACKALTEQSVESLSKQQG